MSREGPCYTNEEGSGMSFMIAELASLITQMTVPGDLRNSEDQLW